MGRLEIKDFQDYQELRTEEMEKVMGGIDTVPLPEKIFLFKPRYNFSSIVLRRQNFISVIPITVP